MNDDEYLKHLMSGAKANGAKSGVEAAEMMVKEGYMIRNENGTHSITQKGRDAVNKVHGI